MSRGVKYGRVEEVRVDDEGELLVDVTVYFKVDRLVLAEFLDALQPFNADANREPIQALLDYSAELGHTEVGE